ncbi:hypothetical protein ACH9L7_16940 (plasmid) [Haloferax sp. S1W]|uniref:DUF7260 family protein n=1 Tax=Haloferax sp. S1W TaxID=3377110 RepID=UPI0037CBF63C
MTCIQRIYDALDRISHEETHVATKSKAVDEFCVRVRELAANSGGQAVGTPHSTTGTATVMAHRTVQTGTGTDLCRRICNAFSETIRPLSIADVASDEPLLTTIREELGEEIALALAPASGTTYSPELRAAVLEAAATRRDELKTMQRALRTERKSVEAALSDTEAIVEDEDPDADAHLLYYSFEELRSYHGRLTRARTRCDRVSRERQRDIHGIAACSSAARVSHGDLISYLYSDVETNYPVLSAIVDLDRAYAARQRAVRDHLTRRV